MNKQLKKRYVELQSEIEDVISNVRVSGDREYVDNEAFIEWKVKARNLLSKTCGEHSEHLNAFSKNEKNTGFSTNLSIAKSLLPVFKAAKSDFEGGFLSSIKSLVQAEIFDSELEQATELLSAGYKTPAAVVAGIVLETGLRDLCDSQGITHAKLDKMNSDLAKAGIYGKLEQKRITALADIRNSAAHGRPDEFTDQDVSDMLRDVERFLTNYLA